MKRKFELERRSRRSELNGIMGFIAGVWSHKRCQEVTGSWQPIVVHIRTIDADDRRLYRHRGRVWWPQVLLPCDALGMKRKVAEISVGPYE